MDNRLYIFNHIPKSAGSNLHKHIEHNVPVEKKLTVTPPILNIEDFELDGIPQAVKKYLATLTQERKDQIQFYYAHQSPYGMHKWINNREPFYFTFVRDPLKKIVSLYNYYSGWFFNENGAGKKKKVYEDILLINGRYPTFYNWYLHRFKNSDNKLGINTNIEFFQKLGYMAKGKPTTKKMQTCLNRFSFMGLTNTFDDDSLYFYNLWGFNKFFIRQNVSKKYFHPEDHPEIMAKIKADLGAGYDLIEMVKEKRAQFIKDHPEYWPMVEETRLKKKLLTPFTQILFDWPENLRMASSYLRKTLPGYDQIKDLSR